MRLRDFLRQSDDKQQEDWSDVRSEQETTQLLQKVYDSFNAGDIEGVLSYFAEDIEFVFSEVPKVSFYRSRRGRDSVAEFFASMGDHQEPKGAIAVQEIIVQGNRAAVFGHASFHVKSTDRDFETAFAHMWTVEGGKLTRLQEYTDTAAISAAY